MIKNTVLLLFIALLILGGTVWILTTQQPETVSLQLTEESEAFKNPGREKPLLDFIEAFFLVEDTLLMRTSLVEEREMMATGEEVLSESIGLYMEYFRRREKENEFHQLVTLLEKYFVCEEKLIAWKINPSEMNSKEPTINAPVDDLRIINQLIIAHEKWEGYGYADLARVLADALYVHSVREKQMLVFNHPEAEVAPLVYNDFEALLRLSKMDDRWQKVLQKALHHTLEQQISGVPFYKDDYWVNQGLVEEGEYLVLENLWIMYYKATIGVKDKEALEWLVVQMDQGPVLGRYRLTEESFSGNESPAIYGVISRIAKIYEDEQLYLLATEALDRMVTKEGIYAGGFVDSLTGQAYSYDQLISLLGY
ncbi:hypothetical protein [Tindallia californiensis]|uniref:Glycosyl hydrolases family 8 n=1 Tax=Tindallia californiensis TaxID=159292 RepID=A0A1H3R8J9_9FIRM|nr:hypothetical protein [Tindallia californiensis]SDZ21558.1 hypothetical protein SAMN05192546_11312 [Tindallia californiensis]